MKFTCAATVFVILAFGATAEADKTYLVTCFQNNAIEEFSEDGTDLGPFAKKGMNGPQGMALDEQGYIYVVNTRASTVEKYSPAGDDLGVFASKSMDGPCGVAIDGAGNVYVSNNNNQTVEKYSPSGADLGVFAHTGKKPWGLTFDRGGNLYVCNQASHNVQKFSPGGVELMVFTLKGYGEPTCAVFDSPGGHDYKNQSPGASSRHWVIPAVLPIYLYVGYGVHFGVEKFSFSGKDLGPVFPQGGRGPPMGMIFNSEGDLYACISGTNLIATITPEGKHGEPFATGAAGPTVIVEHSTGTTFVTRPKGGQLEAGGNATFTITINRADVSYQWLKDGVALSDGGRVRGANSPSLRIARVNGADSGIYRVRITREDAAPSSAATNLMVMAAPTTMDTYLVSYPGCRRIEVFSMDGADLGAFVTTQVPAEGAMVLDRQGNLYIVSESRFEKFSPEGKDLGGFVSKSFGWSQNMVMDEAGNFYFSKPAQQIIEKFSPTEKYVGVFARTAKNRNVLYIGPTGLALDRDGNLYVSDQADNTVKKFSPAGELVMVSPIKNIEEPKWLALDRDGNIYVSDFKNGIVEKLSPAGKDFGVFLKSERHIQEGLYFDRDGNLYICDGFKHDRNVIRKISPGGKDLGVFASTGTSLPIQMILRPGSE